jgi:hypothetical protein
MKKNMITKEQARRLVEVAQAFFAAEQKNGVKR